MGEEVINAKFVRSGRLYTDSLGQASRRLGSEPEDSGTDAHSQNLTGSSKGLVPVPNIEQNSMPNNSQSDSMSSSFFDRSM
jgi:hypothetical protein